MKTMIMDKMPIAFRQKIKESNWQKYFVEDSNIIEIAIIRTQTHFDKKLFEKFPKLKLIIRAGTGIDNIDLRIAESRGITVCNTPEANAISAYEQTISFIFALLKKHQIWKKNLLAGKWKKNVKPNREFSDIRALVVGIGKVGTRVAHFLNNMGAQVKGVDPYLTKAEWSQKNIFQTNFENGLKWCNLITFHCPLTKETINYFSGKELAELSNKIWLINTARGKIVNEDSIEKGLENGQILGYAADVYPEEPCIIKPFYKRDNVYLSPHIGAFTLNAKERLVKETLKIWESYVFKGKIINRINFFSYYNSLLMR